MKPTTILVLEDNSSIRKVLKSIIDNDKQFVCLGYFASAEEALSCQELGDVEIALVDIHLPGISGVEFVKKAKQRFPKLLCLMCTSYDEDELVFSSLKAGAAGYLLKKGVNETLIENLLDLKAGGSPMSSSIARKVINSFTPSLPAHPLTEKEFQIVNGLSRGLSYQEIADELFLSIDTIRTYIRSIYEKLEVNSKTQAINKIYPNR